MLECNSNTMQCFIIETSSQTKKTRTGWGPWGGRHAVRGEGQGDGGWRWEHVGNSIQSRAVCCWRSLRSAIRFAPLRGERAVCSRAGSVGRTNHWRKNYWTDGDGCTLVSFRTLSACLSKFPNSLCIRQFVVFRLHLSRRTGMALYLERHRLPAHATFGSVWLVANYFVSYKTSAHWRLINNFDSTKARHKTSVHSGHIIIR